MNLWTIFLTGLFTGGLSCMAVQGGLLATSIAQRQEDRLKEGLKDTGNVKPILAFLMAKLAAYTILGFLLGSLGSVFQISPVTSAILQSIVALFMIGTALNIPNVHPIFRYFVIQPPKFLTRLVRNQSKSKDLFAPAILGSLTIFIPCGTTQAMMVLAIGSGNPIVGAAILASFVLGTSPIFFILGYTAQRLTGVLQSAFMKVAAIAIIILALFNLNNSLTLSGSTITLGSIIKDFYCTAITFCDNKALGVAVAADNNQTIRINSSGYSPDNLTVKAGSNITLQLVNENGGGCIQAFTIPKMNIQKVVRKGTTETVQFKAPEKPQDIVFACSMGMFTGTIHVVES